VYARLIKNDRAIIPIVEAPSLASLSQAILATLRFSDLIVNAGIDDTP